MKPTLIVLSAGQREYREPMLRRIAERYSLLLVAPEPVTWEKEHVLASVVVDPSDTAGFVAAALQLAREYPVAGLFTYDEWCVETAATIGASLGVPQCAPAAAARCRDKWASREAMKRDGVPSAESVLVWSPDEARQAAARIGYPVVLKPRARSASFGVARVDTVDELPAAFERASSTRPKRAWEHEDGVLVEEYLPGNEISVDSVVTGGAPLPVVFARKVLGYPPHFEEIGHIVGAPERVVADPERVREVVAAAHRALGVDDTVTHTELRLTPSGPRVVEVNGRLGGGLIAELAWLATGVDIGGAAADVAAGRPATAAATATRDRVAGIRFLYAETSGTLVSRQLAGEVADAPWVARVQWLAEPGERVRAEPGRRYFARVGFVIVTADSVAGCEARMREAAQRCTVTVDP